MKNADWLFDKDKLCAGKIVGERGNILPIIPFFEATSRMFEINGGRLGEKQVENGDLLL